MHRKKFVLFGIIGAMLLGLAGGALAYVNVSAQASTPTPGAPGNQAQPGKGRGARDGGLLGGYSVQDLATALEVDVTKLQEAYKAANSEALKEAVSKGLITQAQADQMIARGIDNRPLGGIFGDRSTTGGIDYNALLANTLGIDVARLQAAYAQALNTNLDNAVKAGTITQAQADLEKGRYALQNDAKFQANLQTAYEAAVKQAVTDGVISQAQADLILQDQTGKRFPGFPGGFGGPDGFRPHGFDGGPGGGPDGNQPPQAPAQPTAAPGSGS
jgi:hypothetical protein